MVDLKNQLVGQIMTAAMLIKKVREELGSLDVEAEKAVAIMFRILQSEQAAGLSQPTATNFLEHNRSSEKNGAHDKREKARLAASLTEANDPINLLTKKRQIFIANKRRKLKKMMITKIAVTQFASLTTQV